MSPLMKSIIKLGAIVLAIGLVSAETASAQYGGGGFGSGLGGGGTGMGGGSGGGFGAGGTGMGGGGSFGGMGSSTTGGAFGNRSVGSMPTGNGAGSFTGSNQNSLVTGQLFNLNLMNNAGVSGIGNFQTSTFVGGGGASNFVGGLANRGINVGQNGIGQRGAASGQFSGGQFGARQFGGGAYGQQNNRQTQFSSASGTRSRSQMPISTTYKIGFAVPTVASSDVSTKLSGQLSRSGAISSAGGVSVDLEGKTAVLRGTVATDHDRQLAALVAMLEPGVSQVRNELQVQSASLPQGPVARLSPSSSSATPPTRGTSQN